jgi:hypothetical protein
MSYELSLLQWKLRNDLSRAKQVITQAFPGSLRIRAIGIDAAYHWRFLVTDGSPGSPHLFVVEDTQVVCKDKEQS